MNLKKWSLVAAAGVFIYWASTVGVSKVQKQIDYSRKNKAARAASAANFAKIPMEFRTIDLVNSYQDTKDSIEKLRKNLPEQNSVGQKLTKNELEVMTVKEINDYATSKNIALTSKMRKEERIDHIIKLEKDK